MANPPAPSLVSVATNDPFTVIASFVLFNRNAAEPAGIFADEIRVGSSWASVTPPAEVAVAPSLNIVRTENASVLFWSTNASGFLLQSNPGISAPGSWTDVSSPVYSVANKFFVTNTTSGSNTFYRLRDPQ